ncbi:penicillin-binding protein activator [Gilliamella sp. wkB112]|uniref:penicillin-binding protein activator n=1 Tax=Gilliamella sp. wkB112 TaxID=3120257 RepID=UPI00159ED59F|nr:penicillin-binding protein activator [Gilliamella apicola]
MSKKVFDYDDTKGASYYLTQVDSSSGQTKINWQLLAVRALVKENKFAQANSILSSLPSGLSIEQQQEKLLSQAEIAVKTGKSVNLNEILIPSLSNSQLYRYYEIKLSLDGKNKRINDQAHDYIELGKYATGNQEKQVINASWSFFSKLNPSQISTIIVYDNETILQGWIDLSYAFQNNSKAIAKQEDDTPEIIAEKTKKQKESLKQIANDWLRQHPDHPAKAIIPLLTGEQTLSIDSANAKKVALLLPLNGSSRIFGETIRQGYSDAIKFFPQEPQQNLLVLDTTTSSLESLIQQAQEQNVELIVGPLLKEEVIKIKQLAPTIPVLALNKVDDNSSTTNKMCYFALSPEDEAKDAADHIYAQNKQSPLLLVPQNDLGQRVAQSFAKQWSKLSSNTSRAYVQYFGNTKTLSANMNRNVGISLTGAPIFIDSEPTLYSGLGGIGFDAIYIYSSYDELTLIKPMLDMGASKAGGSSLSATMIYSSSKSHVAHASTDFYYDMNHTEYADIPMIANRSSYTVTLPSNIENDYSLLRLYAMGIDAWRLANRFNQLDSEQIDFLNGMTGKLSTTEQCKLTRSLSWQQYLNDSSQQPTPKSE